MKLLFVYDHVFLKKGNLVYSDKLYYNILKRYLDIFSSITIVARSRDVEDTQNLSLASGDRVKFIFLESISSIRSHFGLRKRQEKIIEALINSHDGLIVRVPSQYGHLAASVAHRLKKQYAVEAVGCAWESMWYLGGIKSKIYTPYYFYEMKTDVKYASHVLYVTDKFLQNRYPSANEAKIINVSNVELIYIDNNILFDRLEKINQKDQKIIFGTIGTLRTKYKGIHLAIKALAALSIKFSNFEYHVLGSGNMKKEYEVLAEKLGIDDRVFFDGVLPGGEAVLTWLDNIDIYLQPSLTEGLPRALIEALSRACPTVGSSVGGIPDLLDKKVLFNPKKVDELSNILFRLVSSKSLMKEEAKRNFEVSKQYKKSLLDKKRKQFLLDFSHSLK